MGTLTYVFMSNVQIKTIQTKQTHDALNDLAAQTKLVRQTWIKMHLGLDGSN